MNRRLGALLAFAALLMAVVGACGDDSEREPRSGPASPAGAPQLDAAISEPAPTVPPPVPTAVPASQGSDDGGGGKAQLALPAQNRIIVHTARMSLVVDDVALTVDSIADVATDLGGWVVSSDRSSRHSGAIAIRVPAALLDEAFRRLEALALKVDSRAVTSEDVTDEYVDSQSRLVSLRATEERLLSFLDRAGNVDEALRVQKEVSDLQLRIEEIQGRLNFLEQTAAYSLIEVSLKLTAEVIEVDAGVDVSFRVGQIARFRASFTTPQGIDDFSFVWDFGDGSSIMGSGSVLRPDGKRITATVNHVYDDDRDSPYIVTIDLTGTGVGGIGEGSDSLEVSVSHVPTIEVFAGEDRTVEEGDKVDYNASFIRPEELWDYQYQWDFGDGSPTVTGKPEEGTTRVETTHVFSDYRPTAYTAVLTVSAMSDAGRVSGSGSFSVRVTESEGFFIGGWNVGGTAKAAVRALSAVAWAATTVIIWLGILSPVILVVGGIAYLVNRRARRRVPPRPGPEYCTKCGGKLGKDAKFCATCGLSRPGPEATIGEPPTT